MRMLKLLAIVALIFMSYSCGEISAKSPPSAWSVSKESCYIEGMHYEIFVSTSGDIFVVNVTKDKLECGNLK